MKRCPQCEFIYEDDQSLCDMDGALLVLDARTLPNLHALATVDVPLAPRAHWRHRTFPAMAALILATVLSLVYFVSTQRTAPVSTPLPQAPLSSAATTTAPTGNDAAVTAKDEPPPIKDESKPEPPKPEPLKTNVTAATTNTTAPAAAKRATAKTPSLQTKAEEPKKDDSKVGSILKKTGRLLKKPFKL